MVTFGSFLLTAMSVIAGVSLGGLMEGGSGAWGLGEQEVPPQRVVGSGRAWSYVRGRGKQGRVEQRRAFGANLSTACCTANVPALSIRAPFPSLPLVAPPTPSSLLHTVPPLQLFGMNVTNHLEEDYSAFLKICIGSACAAVGLWVLFVCWAMRFGLMNGLAR